MDLHAKSNFEYSEKSIGAAERLILEKAFAVVRVGVEIKACSG